MPLGDDEDRLIGALAVLIEQSLALWALAGTVTRHDDGLAIVVGAKHLAVERQADDLFGWRLAEAGSASRPCTSVLDVIRALRARLLDEGPAARLRHGYVDTVR